MNKQTLLFLVILLAAISSFILYCSLTHTKEPYDVSSPIIVWSWWENKNGNLGKPEMVQRCLQNWKSVGKINDFRVLNPTTINQYIPSHEYQKICKAAGSNLAVKSDFIGLYLLFNLGGTWMDATNYLHSPLSEWCSGPTPILYRARRYSQTTPCIETFFMHAGDKGYSFFGEWYNKLLQIAPRFDDWCNRLKQQYPGIAQGMEYGNYLWVYLVGKKILMDNPELLEGATVIDSEDGPWKESIEQNWDVDKTCQALTTKGRSHTRITKLDNELRKKCNISIVPV